MFGIQDIHRDTKRLTMSIHSDISLVDVVNIFFSLSLGLCVYLFALSLFLLFSIHQTKRKKNLAGNCCQFNEGSFPLSLSRFFSLDKFSLSLARARALAFFPYYSNLEEQQQQNSEDQIIVKYTS